MYVGGDVGAGVGLPSKYVGIADGCLVGEIVGTTGVTYVGAAVGTNVGDLVGLPATYVGARVGSGVGLPGT